MATVSVMQFVYSGKVLLVITTDTDTKYAGHSSTPALEEQMETKPYPRNISYYTGISQTTYLSVPDCDKNMLR